ncbi:MAG: DNA gyrase subunit A [Filifactoraceae bacterium]
MDQIIDKILDREIKKEMEESYIDYAMSVIAGRALPDIRDGLKPVHRRILFAMGKMGLTPDKGYRKSATVVGEVLGKYHPHGDVSVYDAMTKMAQDFSMRNPLVDGHGNFGSIDGDEAAAMRYTEARMSKLALEMLKDIEKNTVDMMPNFDEREKEPIVLPARYPNLLVNGSNGIAVGMATSIPPHNLGEVIDAVVEMIDNKEADLEEIISHIKGPDFPTGATILGKAGMMQAYRTGRGKVVQRAVAEIDELPNGKPQIIITEIPYQVNKARLVEKIADLVKEKRIDGITDLRDESDRNGIRIVIELRKDVNANVLLNNLYKYSQLQQVFSIIMLSIVNGEPKILNLKEMLSYYLEHQVEVIKRRTEFDLKKAEDRAHILEGLLLAINNIDRVIKIIRESYQDAGEKLMETFGFTEIQAKAILDMQLRRLQGLEGEKLEAEYNDLKLTIEYLKSILESRDEQLKVVREEIIEVKEKYNSPRRTQILESEDEIDILELIEDEEVAITLTHLGYIKRVPIDTYKAQKRGGKGVSSITTRDEDFVEKITLTSNHQKIVLLTNMGRVYRLNAYEIPQSSRTAKGTNLINLIPIEKDEKVTSMISVSDRADDEMLVMCTEHGIIKKTYLGEFRKSNRNGLKAISLREDDKLVSVQITDGNNPLIVVTREGKCITFDEKDIRTSGRTSMGVRAVRLNDEDRVVAMEVAEDGKDMLVISEKGYGKRTAVEEYRVQSRGGKGSKTYKISEKTGALAGAKIVAEDEEIMIINTDGTLIRMKVAEISRLSRVTSGVRLMKTQDSSIISFEKIAAEDEEQEE